MPWSAKRPSTFANRVVGGAAAFSDAARGPHVPRTRIGAPQEYTNPDGAGAKCPQAAEIGNEKLRPAFIKHSAVAAPVSNVALEASSNRCEAGRCRRHKMVPQP